MRALLISLAGPVEGRRRLIRDLVSRWIEARVAAGNLPPDREEDLRKSLRRMSEPGTEALKLLQEGGHGEGLAKAYADWEYRPSCRGATLHDPAARDSR